MKNKRLVILAATGVVAVVVAYLVLPGPDRVSGCARLEVNTSVESGKIDAMNALAKEYNDSGRRPGGHCVEVSVHATSSGRARQALSEGWSAPLEGAPRPDVWLPTTSLWVELLLHEGKLAGMPAQPLASIAQSPLAIAMPEKMARAMGWPATQVSWREILKRSEEPTGWAAHGHPEWGRFGFGKDNPRKSSSGLAATVATYYAATGKSSDLRVADIDDQNVAAFVLGVEAGVHHYDDDATKFLRTLGQYDAAKKALTYVSAIPLEEQLIYEYNLGQYTDGRKPNEPLVALYPTDGTFMLDHPYVIMPGLDAAQRAGADDFLAYILEKQPLADKGFRLPDPEATLKHEIPGMLKLIDQTSLRRTPSGAVITRMLQAWDTMRKQADILFVIDVSGSMEKTVPDGRQRMQVVQDVLIAGIDGLPPVHNVALWTFSSGINRVLPLRPLGDTRQQLSNAITGLRPDGATALYRAVREGHREMAARVSKDRITAVIVLSDGVNEDPADNNPSRLLADIDSLTLEAAGRPSVRVFSVAFTGDANFDVMRQISERTRGRAYDATTHDLNKVFVDVISNF